VTAYEIDRGELRLLATRGMAREAALLTLRDPAQWLNGRPEARERENMTLGERRKVYAETLSRLITNKFEGARVQRAAIGVARSRLGTGRYARLVIKASGEVVLAIGVSEAESQPRIDGVIGAGLVWLAAFNEKRDEESRAKRVWFCLPKGRSQTAMERLTLLDVSHLGVRIECFEVDESGQEMIG